MTSSDDGREARPARPGDLLTAERRLQDAQRTGDVDALDALLHPRLVAAGPDGTLFGKEDDLATHRSGSLRITRLVEQSVEVQDDGSTGTTRVVADVDAVQDGTAVSARLRYTRLWVRDEGRWRVLAATFAPLHAGERHQRRVDRRADRDCPEQTRMPAP